MRISSHHVIQLIGDDTLLFFDDNTQAEVTIPVEFADRIIEAVRYLAAAGKVPVEEQMKVIKVTPMPADATTEDIIKLLGLDR